MSRLRRWARTVGVGVGVVLVILVAMVAHSVHSPGGTAEARVEEWGRTHGLRPALTWLEHVRYQHDSPVARLRPSSRGQ